MLTVLTVLVALGIVVSLLMDRLRGDLRPWALEAETAQAVYVAESGIAYQLYLERFSDSADPSFGKSRPDTAGGKESIEAFGVRLDGAPGERLGGPAAPTDTFAFRMDSSLGEPVVSVDRTRAYLDMVSTGKYRNTQVTLSARFGKALDDSIFGPALTLDIDAPLEPFPQDRVFGVMRLRSPAPGMASAPWMQGFTVAAYTASFTDKKYYALEASLQKKLGEPGAISGNGNFSPRDPPGFGKDGTLAFSLGRVELVNDRDQPWVLKGPGRIFCEGEIRVKGLIRLENIQLLSAKDITFEDSVTGDEISAFARGSIFIHDRCRLGIEAVAGKDILLRNRAQTTLGSVLLSVGGKREAKPGAAGANADTINAIRIVNEAVARGFLIAGGPNGRVALATQANVVEGVVMASAVWLAGEVRGPVLARKLLCEGTNTRNCLGPGRIDRSRLPSGFVQPLQLGPQDRRLYTFRLMKWKRS
jgi:hypothetical protein